MTKQTYGNNDYISFAYDSLDRLAEKSYNDRNNNCVAKKQYLYGNDGNISVTVDFASNSYTRYNYDLSGRTASIREYSGTDVSSNIPISYTEYKYADKTNYLTNVKHFSPIGTQNIAYKYGNVNNGEMPDQVYSVSWNGVEKVTNKFDSLSRLSKRTVNGLATNYTYKDLEGNQTTTLVKSIETVGITHTYEYDSLGNITSIYDGSKTTTYKYDALNQLVRADNPYENKTHIYTYENGNITEDKVYQYTVGTSEPSDLIYIVKYSYSNENWADVLTGVERIFPQDSVNAISLEHEETPEIVTRLLGENAQRYDMKSRLSLSNNISALSNSKNEYYAVTSDEIGNITSYDGLNYTWVGRQLKSVSPVGNPSVGATYSYNSDGQRIGKNIILDDGETYDYDYYYNGDILAGYKLVITDEEGQASTHIVTIMYDENGEAFGFNYNGNDYYYVRNAQNDVIFISNSDNTGVVMYQYDAWGNMTACYDTSDDGMLSIVNPYAYRGYFYEIETNSYFLKSRYYNPELCRFISADGYVQTGQGVLSCNAFSYCANNPVIYYDVSGCYFISIPAEGNGTITIGLDSGDPNLSISKSGDTYVVTTKSPSGVSKEGKDLIKNYDSIVGSKGKPHLDAYYDKNGVKTIGWGHTGDMNPKNVPDHIDYAQAELLFQKDLNKVTKQADKIIIEWDLSITQQQYDAAAMYGFQHGPNGMNSKSMYALLIAMNSGDSETVQKILSGSGRRKDEYEIYAYGDYVRNY